MNKKIKKILVLFFFFLFSQNGVNASLLWDINFGINEYRKNNYKTARDYFLNYIKSNPNDEEGYYWLAKSYWGLKDNKKANENFKKAHELTIREKNIEKLDFNYDTSSNLEDYFDMAAMYFETGDMKEAEFYADMMLKMNPKSPSAYFIKAKIAQINGENEKAIEYINKAIIFNNKLIKTNLAKSLNVTKLPEMTLEMYEIFALEAYFSPDTTSAIRYCRKYLEVNPSNIDMSNLLIDLYIKNNELALAQILLSDVLNQNGNNIQAILYQAKIHELRKDERLEATLLSAYKINPNNAQVLLEIGNYYLKKDDFLNAKKYFEILINVNDALYEGYFGYIYSLIETGEIENAMNIIRKFIAFNPDSSEGYYLLSKICDKNGNYKDSYDYLCQAIEKAKNPRYYIARGKVNYILKKYNDALNDFKTASKLPCNEKILNISQDYLIKTYLKTNDLINAQMLLNKKLLLDKNRIMYKYNLYILYKLQGNEKRALELFNEIKKAKLISTQDYIDLSDIYLEEEQYESSIKIIDKAIKKFSKDYLIYSQKIKIYSYLNKNEEIKEILNKMTKIN